MKLGSTLLLSVSAFTGISGAFAVIAWWFVFARQKRDLFRGRMFLVLFAVVALVSTITQLAGGDGFSYLIRLSAILLVAGWVYSERKSGEFLDVSVWLFGTGRGFDLGLIAEMGMQTLDLIRDDIENIRNALKLKRYPLGFQSILPIGVTLVFSQIRRSHEQAQILAVRGFSGGGTAYPEFRAETIDKFALFFAVLICFSAFIRVRDIFIVIH